jgi:hypothetical protein
MQRVRVALKYRLAAETGFDDTIANDSEIQTQTLLVFAAAHHAIGVIILPQLLETVVGQLSDLGLHS